MSAITFEYEIVLRVTDVEESNPDMPSLNVNTYAQHIADLCNESTSMKVAVKTARLVGEVKP